MWHWQYFCPRYHSMHFQCIEDYSSNNIKFPLIENKLFIYFLTKEKLVSEILIATGQTIVFSSYKLEIFLKQ